jgi:hypothetical protein
MSPEVPPYRLITLRTALEVLRTLGNRAVSRGRGPQFTAILRRITAELVRDPAGWGDPLQRLRHGMCVYGRGYETLHLQYAVDEDRRLVILFRVATFSGSPYEE